MNSPYDQVKFLETILDNIPEPIYVLDKHGKFIYVNRALIDLSGTTKKALLEYDMYRMAREGIIERAVSDDVLKYKRPLSFFQDVVNLRGKPHRQLNTVTPIFDRNGNIEYMIAVLLPLHRLNQRIHAANSGQPSTTLNPQLFRVNDREVIAESRAMKQVLELAKTMSDLDTAVLITGETGCGKDVVARLIHNLGRRSKHPFITVNCASLLESLLEAELFGYSAGAFTGAASGGKPGLIDASAGGTLFLDEINSMPLPLQGKLLQAIETKSFTRVGSVKSKTVDFRVVAASNQDLAVCVHNGTFRQDLYYRLNVFPIFLPALRERPGDLEDLVRCLLARYSELYHRKAEDLEPEAAELLRRQAWRGNIRELENVVTRVLIRVPEDQKSLTRADFAAVLPQAAVARERPPEPHGMGATLAQVLEETERACIRQALEQCGGDKNEAAHRLGLPVRTLYYKCKKLGL